MQISSEIPFQLEFHCFSDAVKHYPFQSVSQMVLGDFIAMPPKLTSLKFPFSSLLSNSSHPPIFALLSHFLSSLFTP